MGAPAPAGERGERRRAGWAAYASSSSCVPGIARASRRHCACTALASWALPRSISRLRGVAAFLDRCTDPTYGRIVWHEGPRALGMQRWREVEYRYNYGLVEQMVRGLTATGDLDPTPLVPTSRLIFHLLGEAGMAVAEADPEHQAEVRREFEGVLRRILEGLRPKGVAPT